MYDWDPADLRKRLEPLLRALAVDGTGVTLRELRPRTEDYPKVFAPAVVDRARERYELLWAGPIDFRRPDPGADVEMQVAPARGGEVLLPGRVWAKWRYVVPGQTAGLSYDGLVWCDYHWAWFPKPHRL
ncbi:hypothetical protein [Paractinoplanes durhamensis]|uniref:Uncharacterized protein n=1 Tax=Paractinoplanes durhamensis TaxID=113563 RepID=A0ABQ3YW48_9ACTN|nr:hypothetical protein [Actinoplanes durhamensis]GIE01817.1 hypothetical protein Adu01nite_31670 [Actinoplanes durhamensis]